MCIKNQATPHKQKQKQNKTNKKQQRASWLFQNQEICYPPYRIGSEHHTDDLIICQTGTHNVFVYTDIFVQTDIRNIIFFQLMLDWRQLWHAWYILRHGFQTFKLTVSHYGYLSWPWFLDYQAMLSVAWNNQLGTASRQNIRYCNHNFSHTSYTVNLRWPEIVISDVTDGKIELVKYVQEVCLIS